MKSEHHPRFVAASIRSAIPTNPPTSLANVATDCVVNRNDKKEHNLPVDGCLDELKENLTDYRNILKEKQPGIEMTLTVNIFLLSSSDEMQSTCNLNKRKIQK
jgi:hypothetical protein